MAIIYTYPKLQAPQGNELIVVTDVNNKNATRLITVASIAALVPGGGGGGCSTAITGIQTDAGNYAAPLCNEVTFTGSGITISADQATSTVTFTADPPTLACATSDKSGVVKVNETKISVEDEIVLSTTGTHYALQVNDDCIAGVRIPEASGYTLPCSTATVLGGTKNLQNTSVSIPPQIAQEGTYYPVEVMIEPDTTADSCRAIVKVPSSGSIACATPEDLGGIYANTVNLPTGNPAVSGSGTYYPVQLITGSDEDNCFPVVRVPDNSYTLPCTTATTLGGIKAPAVTEVAVPNVAKDGVYYPVEVLEESPSGSEFDCRAVLKVPNVEVTCADSEDIGGIKVAAASGDSGTVAEEGNYYPVQVDENCFGVVRVPDSGSTAAEYLIKSAIYQTTRTDTETPSKWEFPDLSSASTVFEQVKFTPSLESPASPTNNVYITFKRPAVTENYVKVVVKMTILTADISGALDERIMIGLHHDDTNQSGANLTYNWQAAGDYDRDDVSSGDQLIQIQFTRFILVEDLLNIDGEPASSGEDVNIYVKGIYDSSSTIEPYIVIGRYWNVNPTTTAGSNEAAGPVTIDIFDVPSTKLDINPEDR